MAAITAVVTWLDGRDDTEVRLSMAARIAATDKYGDLSNPRAEAYATFLGLVRNGYAETFDKFCTDADALIGEGDGAGKA